MGHLERIHRNGFEVYNKIVTIIWEHVSLLAVLFAVSNKYLKIFNFCLQYLVVHDYFDRAFHIIFGRYQIIAATVMLKMQISAAVIYAKDGEKIKLQAMNIYF